MCKSLLVFHCSYVSIQASKGVGVVVGLPPKKTNQFLVPKMIRLVHFAAVFNRQKHGQSLEAVGHGFYVPS